MKHIFSIIALPPATIGLLLSVSGHAFAQDKKAPFEEMAACQEITPNEARLACFDFTLARVLQARENGDLSVIDRAQVQEARRQLFGFSTVPLPALFGKNEPSEQIEAISTTLDRAVRDNQGRWLFHLTDGSQWRQVDNETYHLRPVQGDEVRVRRATLGSYFLNLASNRAVRVRRE
ncbi:hypothetical protein D8I30_12020 [Brevundimonas naejangsanensis]|uniref:Uncharacterized protein n=1 Tax=Brevundimonas naejangsanensis TaxID=588932 RepID=A0A494RK24_9CAUL|nr:hypothetical protein [Brevundimonas naejangsanensis]AYG95819.1 hypothetical protein D8I30_12020 [Brevundimonas naejangsanensis]